MGSEKMNMFGGVILLVIGLMVGAVMTAGYYEEKVSSIKREHRPVARMLNISIVSKEALPMGITLDMRFKKGRYVSRETISNIKHVVRMMSQPYFCKDRMKLATQLTDYDTPEFDIVHVIIDDYGKCPLKEGK